MQNVGNWSVSHWHLLSKMSRYWCRTLHAFQCMLCLVLAALLSMQQLYPHKVGSIVAIMADG